MGEKFQFSPLMKHKKSQLQNPVSVSQPPMSTESNNYPNFHPISCVFVRGLLVDDNFIFMGDRENLIGELVIPDKVRGMDIKKVSCFYSCKGITRLVLSEGISSIDERAFWGGSNLQEIVFPKTISWLAPYLF